MKKFLVILLIIIALLIGVAAGAFFYLFGGMDSVTLDADGEELGVTEGVSDKDIENIALFGVDTRNLSKVSGRSDAIMVMSINRDTGVINLISILRDSKVPIEGHGENKINAAFAYGGPELAIKTINTNFRLDITDYVAVNFAQLADIVDAVGGVTLTLTEGEVRHTNSNMNEKFAGEPKVQHAGEVTLTGPQAVSYARIRHLDSDNARAGRQQKVIKAIMAKVQTMPKSSYPSVIHDFMSTVQTSLGYTDLIGLSSLAVSGFTINEYTIPDEDYETDVWGGIDSKGKWVWEYDIDKAADRIHSIIYE